MNFIHSILNKLYVVGFVVTGLAWQSFNSHRDTVVKIQEAFGNEANIRTLLMANSLSQRSYSLVATGLKEVVPLNSPVLYL